MNNSCSSMKASVSYLSYADSRTGVTNVVPPSTKLPAMTK